jgi:exonuclease III
MRAKPVTSFNVNSVQAALKLGFISIHMSKMLMILKQVEKSTVTLCLTKSHTKKTPCLIKRHIMNMYGWVEV